MRTASDSVSPISATENPIPRVPGLPLLGNVVELWRDPLGMFDRALPYSQDVIEYRFGPFRYLLANTPQAAEHVLIKSAKRYIKSANYNALRLVLGNGLVTSEGSYWRRQRKLAQPAFHHRSLVGFLNTMARCTQEAIAGWQPGQSIDLHQEMTALTFRIVGLTLFSTDLAQDAKSMGWAMDHLLRFANDRIESVVKLPLWLPTPANRRYAKALSVVDGMIYRIIEARRASSQTHNDLLGLLMAATDESGSDRMTDLQLRDELLTLASAGHETTTNALTFTLYLLSKHPEVEARLVEEVQSVLGDRPPDLQALSKLEYTERVIKESMRLYPPVWVLEREALEDDDICGYTVPKGTIVMVAPYAMHRRAELWKDTTRFDPDRFLSEQEGARPRGAFLPFGAGPRVCIGNAFAMMEAKLIIAMLMNQRRITLPEQTTAKPEAGITLRARLSHPATVFPRN